MDRTAMVDLVASALCDYDDANDDVKVKRLSRFEDAGVLTRDAGIVITMDDGSEFQVTVIQSKLAKTR